MPTSRKPKPIKVVVDTNIIFSALLNSTGSIGEILFNANGIFHFYSCNYMRFEIEKHWEKLLRISKLSPDELEESQYQVLSKIHFINEQLIPVKVWQKSEALCKDIDIDDTDFIALSTFLKGFLWTGDKELYNGLKRKQYKKVYNTQELLKVWHLKL